MFLQKITLHLKNVILKVIRKVMLAHGQGAVALEAERVVCSREPQTALTQLQHSAP